MQDVVIIGSGPAGLSAALYMLRGGFSTTVIGKDNGALEKAEKIENYFGLERPLSGHEQAALELPHPIKQTRSTWFSFIYSSTGAILASTASKKSATSFFISAVTKKCTSSLFNFNMSLFLSLFL